MSKEKIVVSVLIAVIFIAMVVLGVRGLPKEKGPETPGPETPGPEEMPGPPGEPITEPSGMPAPESVGEMAPAPIESTGPTELIEPSGEPVGGALPGEPITEPTGPPEGPPEESAGPEPVTEPLPEPLPEPITEPVAEEPSLPSWQNPEEPTQSAPLKEGQVVEGAIAIEISAEGILPSSFEVKRGETVFLSVSSMDEWTHVFKFKDESLSEVAVGLSSGQTRVITFYAPDEKGEYEYYCDVPGHEARGEKGTMIVK